MNEYLKFSGARMLLKALFEAQAPLNLYEFSCKEKISPLLIGGVLHFLLTKKLIAIEDVDANLTEEGREWILKYRHHIFEAHDQFWKRIPENVISYSYNIKRLRPGERLDKPHRKVPAYD